MSRHRPAPRPGLGADDGNALVEFTYLAVLLMVPLVYVLLTVFQVQRAAFGTTEAARQAGRAFATAQSPSQGYARADAATRIALQDQGITDSGAPSVSCLGGPCLQPGSRVQVTVAYQVRLPLVGRVFGGSQRGAIPVTATHTEYVDLYTSPPPK